MERLKAAIPEDLRALIVSTRAADLAASCAALARHFSTLPEFSQLLEQLLSTDLTSCAKDAAEADSWKRQGNAAFGSQDYPKALSLYTKALRYAPLASKEKQGMVHGTIFINRATTLHKLGLLESAVRDCDRALVLHPSYSKAWYRRGCVKCDLGDFIGAARDMEKALPCESAPGAQLQIKSKLAQIEPILRFAQIPGWEKIGPSPASSKARRTGPSSNSMKQRKTQGIACVRNQRTKEKGWSLQTTEDLSMGSLVFQEDPFAAVVLKSCRGTHCHHCFELLPADPVACNRCAIPVYCSEICRDRASGSTGDLHALSIQSEPGIARVGDDAISTVPSTLLCQQAPCEGSHQRVGEHLLECGGSSWPAALPTEAVLATRMLFYIAHTHCSLLIRTSESVEDVGDTFVNSVASLCHHYDEHSAHNKVELHVLGIVVAYCVKRSAMPLLKNWKNVPATASKLIELMAQVRANAMAIFSMSSPEVDENIGIGKTLCNVEQVKVARGIYMTGSRLNHSCIPNVHASFESSRLFVRALARLNQGSNLELCYGPQVGALPQVERKELLRKSYFFNCTCPACSTVSLPDLFLRSFRCANPDCMGVTLGSNALHSESHMTADSKSKDLTGPSEEEVEGSTIFSGKAGLRATQLAIDKIIFEEGFAKPSLLQKRSIGSCLLCGTVVNVKAANEAAARASSHLERLESDLVRAPADCDDLKWALEGAEKALDSLRGSVHAYSEQLAKGEDVFARLLCTVDQPLEAVKHSQKAIEILERLFGGQNIVVGNEYLKLASVAILGKDMECARQSLAAVDQIFTVHYGSDYRSRLPYVAQIQHLAQ